MLLLEFDKKLTWDSVKAKFSVRLKHDDSVTWIDTYASWFDKFVKCCEENIDPYGNEKYYIDKIYLDRFFTRLWEEVKLTDPTTNGSYTRWILITYANGGINRWEDMETRVNPTLLVFDKLKNSKKIPPESRDIFRIKNLSELEDIVEKYGSEIKNSVSKEEQEKARSESEVYYEDDEVKIIIPKTTFASCYYGRGTRWCTAATRTSNMFDNYNKSGPLYIFLPKKPTHNGEKYQLSVSRDQFMDENDNKSDWVTFIIDGKFRTPLINLLNIKEENIQLAKSLKVLTGEKKNYNYATEQHIRSVLRNGIDSNLAKLLDPKFVVWLIKYEDLFSVSLSSIYEKGTKLLPMEIASGKVATFYKKLSKFYTIYDKYTENELDIIRRSSALVKYLVMALINMRRKFDFNKYKILFTDDFTVWVNNEFTVFNSSLGKFRSADTADGIRKVIDDLIAEYNNRTNDRIVKVFKNYYLSEVSIESMKDYYLLVSDSGNEFKIKKANPNLEAYRYIEIIHNADFDDSLSSRSVIVGLLSDKSFWEVFSWLTGIKTSTFVNWYSYYKKLQSDSITGRFFGAKKDNPITSVFDWFVRANKYNNICSDDFVQWIKSYIVHRAGNMFSESVVDQAIAVWNKLPNSTEIDIEENFYTFLYRRVICD